MYNNDGERYNCGKYVKRGVLGLSPPCTCVHSTNQSHYITPIVL